MKNLARETVLFVTILLFSVGCVLVPVIQSVRELGATPRDRARLLNEEVKKFQDALYWGDAAEALRYVASEKKETLGAIVREQRKKQKTVQTKIESVQLKDGNYEANVEVVVKYYEIPYYLVKERLESQNWKFSMIDGWKLEERNVLQENS